MLLLALALTACTHQATFDDTGTPAVEDPSADGAYAVGTDATEITGSWKVDLLVQTWYPRVDADGAIYHYDNFGQGTALDGGAAACDGPRPVVVFSHGNGGVRWQSYYLTEHLAAHGFIVVAPDHTGNTLFDADVSRMPEVVFRRPVDVADSFDMVVARSADPKDPLYGCVDPQAGYAVMGHSFGGYTALAVAGAYVDTEDVAKICAAEGGWLCDDVATWAAEHPGQTVWDGHDPRVWAAVAMSPASYETLHAGLPSIQIATMIQIGTDDTLTPWKTAVRPIWQALTTSPRALALVEGAGHYSFSDACELTDTFPDCAPPYTDPAVVHALSRTLALAWANQARGVRGMDAWLPPDDPLVSWQAN